MEIEYFGERLAAAAEESLYGPQTGRLRVRVG
jgi:hypothetical protein